MTLAITVLAAVLGGALLEFLRIPAGALVGAMVGVAVVRATGNEVPQLPNWAQFVAFIAVGWLIGQGMTPAFIRTLVANASSIVIAVLFMMVFGGILAFALTKVGAMDAATAFLATSPGGLTQMSAMSAAIGANAPLVTVFHITRVLLVVLAAPFILRAIQP